MRPPSALHDDQQKEAQEHVVRLQEFCGRRGSQAHPTRGPIVDAGRRSVGQRGCWHRSQHSWPPPIWISNWGLTATAATLEIPQWLVSQLSLSRASPHLLRLLLTQGELKAISYW